MNYRNYITKRSMLFMDVVAQYLKSLPVTAAFPTIDSIEDNALIIQIHPKRMRLFDKSRQLLFEFGPRDTLGDVAKKLQELRAEGRISGDLALYSTTKQNIVDVPLSNITHVVMPR